MHRLWLEDLHVGQRFSGGAWQLETDEIKAFAARYDPQPFHLDENAAAASFFAGLAASGWNTAAATMRMMVETVPIAGGLIGSRIELAWPRPTRPGDVLRIDCVIEAITPSRSRPDRGKVTLRCETRNQKDELVQSLVSDMLVFRRPAPSPQADTDS